MATLNDVDALRRAFYRLVGSTSDDAALVENGESAGEVADLCLTHGFWAAQRHMIACGMANRWRVRSGALAFSGTEAADGGRYMDLPDDFLRLSGSQRRSSIVEADGSRWGQEIEPEQEDQRGDYFYIKNAQLWITRGAEPPTTAYLEYQYRHPEIADGVTLDFPTEARMLPVAVAAEIGMAEGWFPYEADGMAKIVRAADFQRMQARRIARESREPRKITSPRVIGTHYFA